MPHLMRKFVIRAMFGFQSVSATQFNNPKERKQTMRKSIVIMAVAAIVLLGGSRAAFAGCEFSSGPCSTDSSGHTYRTEQGLGGGYKTTRDGSDYSHTSQTLGGGYRTDYNDGRSEFSNRNPYETNSSSRSGSGYGSGGLYSSDRKR